MEPLGRVFAAVPLSPDARLAVADQIRAIDIPGRLAPPGNWHLTSRFLGAVDHLAYDVFIHRLSESVLPRRFGVSLSGLGAFPNVRRATVVWVGVSAGLDELRDIKEAADAAAHAAGLGADDRPYRPHLTLSRVQPPQDVRAVLGGDVSARYVADRVVVFKSQLGRGGARYEPLEEFMLSR